VDEWLNLHPETGARPANSSHRRSCFGRIIEYILQNFEHNIAKLLTPGRNVPGAWHAAARPLCYNPPRLFFSLSGLFRRPGTILQEPEAAETLCPAPPSAIYNSPRSARAT
jgi:hypothetical protein